jgi:outer membrane protein
MVCAVTLHATPAHAQDSPAILLQAETLLAQGKAAEAYQLLEPLEAQNSNDARFQYLLGASLLESNLAAKAIIPLKRALGINPLFAAARLDLGRAHFAVGNIDEAKSAFNTALYQNPPPVARQAIDYHLAEIERRGNAANLSGDAYISATFGRDNNVPGGLEDGRLYIAGLEDPFLLDKNNIKAADAYLSYNAGATVRLALDHDLAVFASADVQRRDNNTLRNFDSINGSLNLGVEKNFGQANLKLSGNFGRGILDYVNLRRNNGGTVEWRYNLSRLQQLTLYAQKGRINYFPASFQNYNIDQKLFGLSWFNVSEASGNPSFSIGLNYGQEKALGELPDGNKRTLGARLGSQVGVGGGLLASAGVGYSSDQFDIEREILFDTKPGAQPTIVTRSDRKLDFNLGLNWIPELNWSVRPNFTHTRATSNISIYEFTRNDFSLSVRRDFR